jgi:mRNA interferase MazF
LVTKPWVPKSSEIIRLDFSPVAGHEQGNVRPAVVLSHQGFNEKTGLVVVVPCTTKVKGYPFEAPVSGLPEATVALTHQIRTLDWRNRHAVSIGQLAKEEMPEIREKVRQLLGL